MKEMAGRNAGIDKALIRELAEILNETELTEIEVEQGELRVRVSRQMAMAPSFQAFAPPAYAPSPEPAARPEAALAPAREDKSKNTIKSPMVGTAYLASAPGARPFVAVGDQVKEGQTLMIIEAMKTMNQITSPRAGTVTAVLIEDSQPVEYGEPLVVVE